MALFLSKLSDVFDPLFEPIHLFIVRAMARLRNMRLRMNKFKFRTVRPLILPDVELVEQPILYLPASCLR